LPHAFSAIDADENTNVARVKPVNAIVFNVFISIFLLQTAALKIVT